MDQQRRHEAVHYSHRKEGLAMYIRLNMFSVGSGQRAEFERLADRFAPIFKAQKGFQSVTFFEADAAGR